MKQDTSMPNSVHQETWELLPWYINNTLEFSLREQVDQHLEECHACRKELEEQKQLAQAVHQADQLNLSPQQSFAKLMQRIDVSEQTTTTATSPSFSLLNYLSTLWGHLQHTPSMARWLLAAQTLAIVLLLGHVMLVSDPLVDNAANYVTLSNDKPSAMARGHLRVVFSDNSSEQDIRKLLTGVNARIVDGPSTSGVYTLAVSQSHAASREELVALSKQLRSHHTVQFAEPVFALQP